MLTKEDKKWLEEEIDRAAAKVVKHFRGIVDRASEEFQPTDTEQNLGI